MRRAPIEREVIRAGVRTRVLSQGSRKPTLLLLHGFSDSADTWRPLMRELAPSGRRVVAVDLPGFGRAERPHTRRLIETLDAFVADVVRAEGRQDDVVVVGNSLGGLLALRAAQDPELPVAAVAAIGPAGLGFQPWVRLVRRSGRALALLAHAPVPHRTVRAAAGRIFERFAVASGRIDREVLDGYASHIHPGDPARLVGLANRVLAELHAQPAVSPEAIGVPVQLIWGGRDAFCPPRGAAALTDVLPHARLELRGELGHCIQLEDPRLVADLVLPLPALRDAGDADALSA